MLAEHLRYALIPGKPPLGAAGELVDLHDRAFRFWSELWSETFAGLGTGEQPDVDGFLRQDLISVVLQEDDVVALHLYTFFDLALEAARQHSYFTQSFTPRAMDEIRRSGARTAMTFEYFCLAPAWRNAQAGLSLAATLLHVGFAIFARSGADIALGVCRVDVGVAKLCYDAGGMPLDRDLVLHGAPCDLIGLLQGRQRPYRRAAENELAARLWQERRDFSRLARAAAAGG